jgi:hypothetical protein
MDLHNLSRIAPSCGYTLTTEEVAGLEAAMVQRRREENLHGRFQFWGKIFGATQDYLIAVVSSFLEDFPEKKYYYW